MKLYEIDEQIAQCVDPETGEVLDLDRLNALEMERHIKIRNVGLWYKNTKAAVKALKDEEDSFKKRRVAAENRLKGLTEWLSFATGGMPFETEDKAVTIKTINNGGPMPLKYDENAKPEDVPAAYRKVEYSFDGDAIRRALDNGEELDFVRYGERGTHLSVK